MFDFDTTRSRIGTDSAKWYKYHNQDIIPMWVADMDFQSPPAIIDALRERVNHGIFGYGFVRENLAQSVIDYLYKSFQWEIDPKWIVWLPGLVTGLNVCCRSTARTGQDILTTVPVYPPFLSAPKYSQRGLKTTRMSLVGQRWEIDFGDLESAIDSQTRLFLLCNPHNPTGRVFSEEELLRLADICLKNNVVICSDEIHCDLILDPKCRHRPIACLSPEIARQTITLMAPSKTYNIPGLSCSYAIISDDALRHRFKQIMSGIVPHVNVLGMTAALAAYTHGQQWLDALVDYLRSNHDLVYRTIRQINGLDMAQVEATYLAWIDTRDLDLAYPGQWFEKAGVGLSDGKEFAGSGFVRLNFGCSRRLLSQALDRIARAVEGHVSPPR